jgi:hypothetical protein
MNANDITRRHALRIGGVGLATTVGLTAGVGSVAAGKGNDRGKQFGKVWAKTTSTTRTLSRN